MNIISNMYIWGITWFMWSPRTEYLTSMPWLITQFKIKLAYSLKSFLTAVAFNTDNHKLLINFVSGYAGSGYAVRKSYYGMF